MPAGFLLFLAGDHVETQGRGENSSEHFKFSHSTAVPLGDWSGKAGRQGTENVFSRGKTVLVQNGVGTFFSGKRRFQQRNSFQKNRGFASSVFS